MAQRYDFDGTCPVCGDTMYVSRLSCERCSSALEGMFHLTRPANAPYTGPARSGPLAPRADGEARFGRLARLDRAQLEFVEAFLQCRGVIKNVEDMLGISYPTVKARLANVLETMGFAAEEDTSAAERRRVRREILADLAAGRITTEDAHELLTRNQTNPGDSDDER